MINIFFSSFIAIFFLGKSSKDVGEKTARASWFRTCVYLFLTVISFLFFYKSYQVATIVNVVNLNTLRGTEDNFQLPTDTILNIYIDNKFNHSFSYNNKFRSAFQDDFLDNDNKWGGIRFEIQTGGQTRYIIKNRDIFVNDPDFDRIQKEIENGTRNKLSDLGSIYEMNFISTSIPSFIPVFPQFKGDVHRNRTDYAWITGSVRNSRNDKDVKFISTVDGSDVESLSHVLDNGFIASLCWLMDGEMELPSVLTLNFSNFYANTINFLTAADLSQYTYILVVNSDMYIKNIWLNYNLPIEVTSTTKGQTVGGDYVFFSEKEINEYDYPIRTMLHIKLPTMQNLQQIRSLVLTAILTALFSLFCTNLFYCVRKRSMKYRKKHHLKISELRRLSRRRLALFRYFNYTVVFIILSFILFMTCLVVLDRPPLLPQYHLEYKILGSIIGITFLLVIIISWLYKYATTPLQKLRGKKKIISKRQGRKS